MELLWVTIDQRVQQPYKQLRVLFQSQELWTAIRVHVTAWELSLLSPWVPSNTFH